MLERPPIVVHVVHRFNLGGMELGLLKLIDNTPPDRFRHIVVSVVDCSDLRDRLTRSGTPLICLGLKRFDYRSYLPMARLLRQLRPGIVHTRNLGTIEAQISAAIAGVPVRIHGEQGRDIYDLDGRSRRYGFLRRFLRPWITHYTVVREDLKRWLVDDLRVPAGRVTRIYNGVDSGRFHVRSAKAALGPPGFAGPDSLVIGTVGRIAAVKDQKTLVRAFIRILQLRPELRPVVRLVLVGES